MLVQIQPRTEKMCFLLKLIGLNNKCRCGSSQILLITELTVIKLLLIRGDGEVLSLTIKKQLIFKIEFCGSQNEPEKSLI